MKRIIMLFIRCALFVPGWYISLVKHGNLEKYDETSRYNCVRKITRRVLKSSRVTIECFGLENIPKENGFIMFPNHQGLFDALMFLNTCDKPFSVVCKKEVRNIKLLRRVFDALDVLTMDREDVRQSMKVIIEMSNQVKAGRNFVVFAEGTRSREGNKILPFKGGTFKAATKAGCPIVPVALINSFKPFDENNIKKCTTHIHYLPPIYPEEYSGLKTTEIAQMVHDRIEEEIGRCLSWEN